MAVYGENKWHLEEELGAKLFIRGNRNVTLTEEGRFLRKRVQEIVELAERAEAEFHMLDAILSGDVSADGAGGVPAVEGYWAYGMHSI